MLKRILLATAIATASLPAASQDEPLELDFNRPALTIENPHDVSTPGLIGLFAMGVLLLSVARKSKSNTGDSQ